MAAPRVAEYVEELFKNSPVKVARSLLTCANKKKSQLLPQMLE